MSKAIQIPRSSRPEASLAKIPATIITGFLGAGKTTLLRHVLAEAKGRRIAVIVNEFGDIGFDGDLIGDCADPDCSPVKVTELTNGCICCTVADDFIPAIEAILALEPKVDHILIETSGLALPKPLVKAFDWPSIRSRVTVDGVIAVADGPAVAAGRFAEDPALLKPQPDGTIEHDFPLAEVFEDQIAIADIIILNKTDLMNIEDRNAARARIDAELGRPVRIVPAAHGRIEPAILLGLNGAVEDDLSNRPSHHDTELEHDHDDFDSFSLSITPQSDAAAFSERLGQIALDHNVLRTKGFAAIAGKSMRLVVQGVGGRISHSFDRAWEADEPREGRLVVIGLKGLDRAAITAALSR
jgi:cobalamin biosynthesis protein CobW